MEAKQFDCLMYLNIKVVLNISVIIHPGLLFLID